MIGRYQERRREKEIDMEKRKRIEWVDVVKGMLVPLIILGHTSTSEAFITYIYSFHMPLFFLLSGYTARPAKDLKGYGRHIKKSFLHLILPSILVQFLIEFVSLYKAAGVIKLFSWYQIKGTFWRLFWGCAWGWAGGSPSVGMLWFFFTMFWAKLIWEGVMLLFPKKHTAILLFLSLIGIWIGPDHYLPQNLDIALMVLVYFCVGNLIRSYQEMETMKRLKMPAFFAALCFWLFFANQGTYVELAIESYPGLVTSILESICGAYAFCILGQELAQSEFLTKVFSFLGRHTLLFVYLHHMDSLLENYWRRDSWVLSSLYRGGMVLAVCILLIGGMTLIKKAVGANR